VDSRWASGHIQHFPAQLRYDSIRALARRDEVPFLVFAAQAVPLLDGESILHRRLTSSYVQTQPTALGNEMIGLLLDRECGGFIRYDFIPDRLIGSGVEQQVYSSHTAANLLHPGPLRVQSVYDESGMRPQAQGICAWPSTGCSVTDPNGAVDGEIATLRFGRSTLTPAKKPVMACRLGELTLYTGEFGFV
jgi:hypothetical protein